MALTVVLDRVEQSAFGTSNLHAERLRPSVEFGDCLVKG